MQVKFKTGGRYLINGTIEEEGKRLYITFAFNNWLKDEIKALDDVRWHGYDEPNPRKVWSVKNSAHNRFQLDYLTGHNPYLYYDTPLIEYNSPFDRKLFDHQKEIISHIITRRHCIIAGEPGVGKSLAAIEALEHFHADYCWWVSPKSGLTSVRLECQKWHSKINNIQFLTYEGMKKEIANWHSGKQAPRYVIFDEAHKLANPDTQQSRAAQHLADSIRAEYGRESLIVLMTGSPNPKDPTNWWNLCSIACPGFLKEGNVFKLKNRLAKMSDAQGFDGGSYKKLITWWDDGNKCKICGELKDSINHDTLYVMEDYYHQFEASINEVALLYKRLKGLVLVKMKRECLSLPNIVYRKIICKPTQSILNAANIIKATAPTAIAGLILMRELSDGFQYDKVPSGYEECEVCKGTKQQDEYYDLDDPDYNLDPESIAAGYRVIFNDEGVQVGLNSNQLRLGTRKIECLACGATGQRVTYTQATTQVPCPKDDALLDILEQYEEQGRIIIWAGFTASVDRCVQIVQKAGWHVIRLDGRGWYSLIPGNDQQLVNIFQTGQELYPKIVFIGQPGAGGLGLTLTAASVMVYYSCTFKSVERQQSVNRFHRPGADFERGCTVYDLIHLPSDLLVLQNLEKKFDLQNMTLGQMKSEIDSINLDDERLM